MARAIRSRWISLLGIGLFLGLWHLMALQYPPVVLPTPFETLQAFLALVQQGQVGQAVLVTMGRTLTGFGISVVVGGLFGLAAGLVFPLRVALAPLVTVIQGIPPVALIVVALLWFGSGGPTPVFTVAVAVVPLIFVAAVEGTVAVEPALLEMARAFRTPRRMLFADLYLPHLLSYLFPAMLSGLGLAWKVAVMAELMAGIDTGIGAGLGSARVNLNTAQAFAWIGLGVILLLAMEHLLLHPLRRRLEPWRRTAERGGG